MSKTYKLYYTADVLMSVEIDADSKEKAISIWEQGQHYDQGSEEVQEQMENVKFDLIEEVKQNQRMVPHQTLSHLKNYKVGTSLGHVSHRMCMPSSHDPV